MDFVPLLCFYFDLLTCLWLLVLFALLLIDGVSYVALLFAEFTFYCAWCFLLFDCFN